MDKAVATGYKWQLDCRKSEVEGLLACCGALEEEMTRSSILGITHRTKVLAISALDFGRDGKRVRVCKGGRGRSHGDRGEAEVSIAALGFDALRVWVRLYEGVGLSLERHGGIEQRTAKDRLSRTEIGGLDW